MSSVYPFVSISSPSLQREYSEQALWDAWYKKHEQSYKEFDFAVPLFDLIDEARFKKSVWQKGGLDEWILPLHQKMIDQTSTLTQLEKQTAKEYAPALLQVLFRFLKGDALFQEDSLLFHKYFRYDDRCAPDINVFIDQLVNKKAGASGNLIEMFEVIYWMHFFYYAKQTDCVTLAKRAVDQVFLEDSPEKKSVMRMIPGIFKSFDAASRPYFSLQSLAPSNRGSLCNLV